jgi:putative addiction module killer protein
MEEVIYIEYYTQENGKAPYIEWEEDLPKDIRARVRARLNRIRHGNFGDCTHIEGTLYELRIHTGPGYRIYYGKKNQKLVILVCAGSKRSQVKDIEKAKKYWLEVNSKKGVQQ